MEIRDYIMSTLKALVQFAQPFITRYILGTFQMFLRLFLKCSQHVPKNHMVIKVKNFGLMLNTFTMCPK